MAEPRKLTIKQAIAEGYVHYGYAGRDYQSLSRLDDLTDKDLIESEEKHVLASKEPLHHSISADQLIEYASEDYYNNDEFSIDDTYDMEHLMKEHKEMFEEFADKINAIYRKKNFYRITDIELITEEDATKDIEVSPK